MRKWLTSNGVPTVHKGNRIAFSLADLPEPVRVAYIERQIDEAGLPSGALDDAAHSAYLAAPASMRARAERNAGIARLLVSLGKSVGWVDRMRMVRERFGDEGTSKPTLKRILRDVKNVDPINYASALLPAYKGKTARASISPDAWRFFLTTIRDAAPEFPLIQAWRDTRDIGRKGGWDVASYPTFYRRWQDLSVAQRHAARHGRADAVKRLAQPALRDKSSINALEWVSLDGRTQDFWVDFGDGRAVRPVMLALIDVASNMVLDYELGPSENATGTVRLIKRTCERYGIFDRLYTDNGSAFAGHLVAGGNVHRFRNGGKKTEGVQPLGICKIMDIELRFALPKNAQAKIAERVFATLSRVIDDRPEFKGAHAGHAPGASADSQVQPVPVETALSVLRREVARHNREAGRRSQGARGRSYEQVFRDGLQTRLTRKPTARQLYLSGLIYSPVAVDRFGRVRKNGWTYGSHTTQEALLRHHGSGRKILLGRDPDDFSAPAIAFDEDGRLICEGIEPVEAGAYGSVDGIRNAAGNRKAARAAVAAGEAANDYLSDAKFNEALAKLDAPDGEAFLQVQPVVAARFGAPLRPAKKACAVQSKAAVPEQFLRNMHTALAASRSQTGKSA